MSKQYTGWSIKVTRPDGFLAGIMYFGPFRAGIGDLLGVRTAIFRTRQQARNYKKNMYYPCKVVKVKVTIEEIE